jgi:hypothetical protein
MVQSKVAQQQRCVTRRAENRQMCLCKMRTRSTSSDCAIPQPSQSLRRIQVNSIPISRVEFELLTRRDRVSTPIARDVLSAALLLGFLRLGWFGAVRAGQVGVGAYAVAASDEPNQRPKSRRASTDATLTS